MSENPFHDRLAALGQELGALQRYSETHPDEVRVRIPEVIAELHSSLEELERLVKLGPGPEPGSNGGLTTASGRATGAGRMLRFRGVAQRGPVLVRIMGTSRRCRWVNRAWLDFTGRSLRSTLGEGWLEDVHPDDRTRCMRQFHETLDARRLDRMEYRLRQRDGQYGWMLEIATPRRSTRGKSEVYLGTAIDVTAHKHAELQGLLRGALDRLLVEAHDLDSIAVPLLRLLCTHLGFELGELWLPRSDGTLRCAHLWSVPELATAELQAGLATRTVPGKAGAWRLASVQWLDLVADAPLELDPELARLGPRTLVRQPVRVGGETRLMLQLASRHAWPADAAVQRLLRVAALQLGQFLERLGGEERLRVSETRQAALLEAVQEAVVTLDAENRIVEFNAAARTLFGYPRQVAIGRDFRQLLLHSSFRARCAEALRACRLHGSGGQRFEARALCADGSEITVDLSLSSVRMAGASLVTVYVSDLTAPRQAEEHRLAYQERLRSLMADLLLAEERERRQLAEDLHDGLSQTIALTRMKVSALRAASDGTSSPELDEIADLIDQTDRSARSIGFELSPPILHDLGLEPALNWLIENIQARYGIAVRLEDEGRPLPVEELTRVILFRSVRELLINAAKHAHAREVVLHVERAGDALELTVTDDGIGMDPGLATAKGSGLMSIRERLHHVGGSMQIESTPGGGCSIRLHTPLGGRATVQPAARTEA